MKLDFWKFWTGETISSFGSSVTRFAMPLIVFKLTGSAVALGTAAALFTAPHLLFGLVVGAWTDRTDRKRVMIAADILAGLAVASVPVAAIFGILSIWWIYAVTFAAATLSIFFDTAQFGAVPSLVDRDDLVAANGRIQASFAAAGVLGPIAAGALLAWVPVEDVLFIDAASFVVSAISLGLIGRTFNVDVPRTAHSIREDIVEGLRYVLSHPVLRNISLMMAIINVVSTPVFAELVLFAKNELAASDGEVGLLFAAGGIGVVLCSLAAGPLRARWSFGTVALGALMLSGILTVALGFASSIWPALVFWGLAAGLGTLFNINSGSLRQTIVPNQMLGRVMSIAMVLAWSANPVGAVIGGIVIERTGDARLVYAGIGAIVFVVALLFRIVSPLGRAERFLAADRSAQAASSG